jgi:hypothetical protein
MVDVGHDFVSRQNGRAHVPLEDRPSEYFRRQVRVSSFSNELPSRMIRQSGELFMACSNYPHSEGSVTPLADDQAAGRHSMVPDDHVEFFSDDMAFLLGRNG